MMKPPPLRRLWQLTAWLVVWQLVSVQLVAALPELQECCDQHSRQPDHTCAVTLLLHDAEAEMLPASVPLVRVAQTPTNMGVRQVAIENEAALPIGDTLVHAPPRGP